MKRRIISALLAISLLCSLPVLPAAAADANRTVDAYCEHCKSDQTWHALTAAAERTEPPSCQSGSHRF